MWGETHHEKQTVHIPFTLLLVTMDNRQTQRSFPFPIREMSILGAEALCQRPTPDMSPRVSRNEQDWRLSLGGRPTGRLVGPRSPCTTLASLLRPHSEGATSCSLPPCPLHPMPWPLFACSSPLSSFQVKMHGATTKC